MTTPHTLNTVDAHRRQFLGKMGITGVGLVSLGTTSLVTGCHPTTETPPSLCIHPLAATRYPFYGTHQAGITTPMQRHNYFLVADLHQPNVATITKLFKDWTLFSDKLTQGYNISSYGNNPHLPPVDTGEADSLGAWGLTLTFGISPSFLTKLGLQHKAPSDFVPLPHFARDQLRTHLTGGDLCIQACSDDPQVAFHAVRQLVRQARSLITPRYSQMGFASFDTPDNTARNLFGFKDGTANHETLKDEQAHIWINSPHWLNNGTYMVVRTIAMHLETWDRTSLKGQEDTFGRHRDTGAPIGQTDEFAPLDIQADGANIAHANIAKGTGLQMLRRSYSYASGIDSKTGQFDAGLLFISFQKSPKQFIDIQNALGTMDKMTEYTTHIGSGLFACFGGVQKGGYLGQMLFES